jgi:hypothetical protein
MTRVMASEGRCNNWWTGEERECGWCLCRPDSWSKGWQREDGERCGKRQDQLSNLLTTGPAVLARLPLSRFALRADGPGGTTRLLLSSTAAILGFGFCQGAYQICAQARKPRSRSQDAAQESQDQTYRQCNALAAAGLHPRPCCTARIFSRRRLQVPTAFKTWPIEFEVGLAQSPKPISTMERLKAIINSLSRERRVS